MAYEASFSPSYPAWHDSPTEDTPVRAAVFSNYDTAITKIEGFLDGSTAVNPDSKTGTMTSPVGVDENGKLWSVPGNSGGGGGASSADAVSYDNTESELESEDVQGAIDELKTMIDESASGGYVSKTGDTMTGPLIMTSATIGGRTTGNEGANSFAVGRNCYASGARSLSLGDETSASGDDSIAQGMNSTANYRGSIAEGCSTTAGATWSHAAGTGTKTRISNQFVVGAYNDAKTDTYFEVGNGLSNSGRSNAFEVHTSGDIAIGGEIQASEVTTLSNSDFVYVSVSGVIKKISIANLKTVLGV